MVNVVNVESLTSLGFCEGAADTPWVEECPVSSGHGEVLTLHIELITRRPLK